MPWALRHVENKHAGDSCKDGGMEESAGFLLEPLVSVGGRLVTSSVADRYFYIREKVAT